MGHKWLVNLVVTYLMTTVQCQDGPCLFNKYIPPNGKSYILRNPNYPNRFSPGFNCRWKLYTEPGYNINLNCYNVNLDRNGGWLCRDVLSVYGTWGDDNYCSPFNLDSVRNYLLVGVQSNNLSRGGTFLCSVQALKRTNCDCGWSIRSKIVGGLETGVNEFPYMAALVDASKRAQICGATIISQRYVVTAAHCLDALNVRVTGVLVGEHDFNTGSESNATRLYRAKRFIVHPSWTPRTAKNDVALVEVEQPMAFSSRVGPVCLPFNRPDIPSIGEALTVLGWGSTSFGGPKSDKLQKTRTREINMARCQMTFAQSRPAAETQICTFEPGKDACQMDSGGPLLSANAQVNRYFLAGLVSYGLSCGGDDPSVNTRVYSYVNWIASATGGTEDFCVK